MPDPITVIMAMASLVGIYYALLLRSATLDAEKERDTFEKYNRLLADRLADYTLAEARRVNADNERTMRFESWSSAMSSWTVKMKDLDMALMISQEQKVEDVYADGVPADGLYAMQGDDERETTDASWKR